MDLGKELKSPAMITSTCLHPDMIIVSDSTRRLIILELIPVLSEERMDEANEKKLSIYQKVVNNSRRKGWRARSEPLEVGRGRFAWQLLYRVFTALGLKGKKEGQRGCK